MIQNNNNNNNNNNNKKLDALLSKTRKKKSMWSSGLYLFIIKYRIFGRNGYIEILMCKR